MNKSDLDVFLHDRTSVDCTSRVVRYMRRIPVYPAHTALITANFYQYLQEHALPMI